DFDFDGSSYRLTWPGTFADVSQDRQVHSESPVFASPMTNGRNYERIAFEADMAVIETQVGCSTSTGAGCVNPPPGATFYPIYSTTGKGACAWRQGGVYMPGTTNAFGGTSTSEYGPLFSLYYPVPSGTGTFYEDFRNVLS